MEDAESFPGEEFVALSDFTADGSDQMSFCRGDRLLVHTKPCEDWCWAELRGRLGYVPASHLLQCRLSTTRDRTEDSQGTRDSQRTVDSQGSRDSQRTVDSQGTRDRTGTRDSQRTGDTTEDSQRTGDSQGTRDRTGTRDSQRTGGTTEDSQGTRDRTGDSQVTRDSQSTVDIQEEEAVEDPWQDEEYFSSYATLKLHLEMLSDRSRTEAYRQVVLNNRDFLKDKVVLDLGCGTGIISLFCAQLSQPAKVFAVEASPMAVYTRRLVRQNGLEDVVTVLQGRAEELQLPQKVDVLLSEWMGNCLLFEFMVEAVLLVRQRWLAEGGVMWPSSAALLLVPCQAQDFYTENMSFWEKLYGLDFSPLQSLAQQEFFSKPRFSHVLDPDDCLSVPSEVLSLDMYSLEVEDLEEMTGHFCFSVVKSGQFHGFSAWFTVGFESRQTAGGAVELDTGPYSQPTHWKQTLFMLDRPLSVVQGQRISGSLVLSRNSVWRRHMSVTLSWSVHSEAQDTGDGEVGTKTFPMWR